ncbi:MAG: ABC transporter permease [Thermomicrobiales bacterium]
MSARSLRGATRQPDALILTIALPSILMLLFVYVFGGAIAVGTDYVRYVVPGVIVLCAGYGAAITAVSVASDMELGVIDRFRSLPIAGSAVLTGHVVASLVRNTLATAIVLVVAWITGFRANASVTDWLLALALLLLFVLAVSWLATALALVVGSAESANAITSIMLFLPYLSSGFVPTDTMPGPLAAIARHQPYTPLIETIRGLLLGTPIGSNGVVAVAWLAGILVVSYIAARLLFRRHA